jgi:aryl-alcohol dehydrogenase-like predicted oxidoreductase
MKSNNDSRRRFLKGAIGAAGLLAADKLLAFEIKPSDPENPYDPKGLPTTVLGKTGVRIPRIALGLGSRFCNIKDTKDAVELLNYALDNGLYYWDTAHIYENTDLHVVSEERLGLVVKSRRKEIFLSTKVTERNPDQAMRQIELSLKRLQTDHLDILKIHDIQIGDIETLKKKGSLIDVLQKMKEQKVCRFIGFSGHSEATAMKAMAETGIFDTMLMAMNHWAGNTEKRQETAIPAAKSQGMGVMLMKVVRPRENNKTLDPKDLIRYALSLKGPDGIVLGTDSMEVVKSNLAILKDFTPLNDAKMNELAFELRGYYNHENLPWMQHSYHDGLWS